MLAPPVVRRSTAAAALAALSLLAACGGEPDAAPRPEPSVTFTADSSRVLVPGAPGEPAEVIEKGSTGTRHNSFVYGEADVVFVRDMVVHHVQALEMAALAPERAGDDGVRRLAERIAAAQRPEIDAMQGWLVEQGLPEADEDAGHGAHAGMPGMASPEDLVRLRASSGRDFDVLFLSLMTRHHEGALDMADEANLGAQHPFVMDLATDVTITQGVEIERMQELSKGL